MKSLALQYRPQDWDTLVEQSSTKIILDQQLKSGTFKQAYLFVGPAGTGKTTSARIFAKKINNEKGNPIEIDAASHGNVDDIRELVNQAKLKPLDSDYKVFIIDECHCLSSAGWSAMLKLIEEPPATAIFILCTTDVQKVPKTIMSRCQRFDFQRISFKGIVERLRYICDIELREDDDLVRLEALEYIAKIADGGMRDSLTLLDKCLAYSRQLTLKNVVDALGTVDYDVMFDLTDSILKYHNAAATIDTIEEIHQQGKDLKQFLKSYIQFLLDLNKYFLGCEWEYIQIPELNTYEEKLENYFVDDLFHKSLELMNKLVSLQADTKYSDSPKYDIEVCLLLFIKGETE